MAQGKNDKGKKWSNYLVLLGLTVVLLLVLRATWSIYQKDQVAKMNLLLSTQRLSHLAERQTVLQNKIELLKTPRGVEEEIRSNYPVVKAGEQMINLGGDDSVTATTTAKSWWQVW